MTVDPLTLTILGSLLASVGGLTSFLLAIVWGSLRDHSRRIRDIEIKCASRSEVYK
jgi:hypothetical protein